MFLSEVRHLIERVQFSVLSVVDVRDWKDEGERDECGDEEEPELEARALWSTGHLVEELQGGGGGV